MKINKSEFVKAKVHQTVTPDEAIKMICELQGLSQADFESMTDIAQANISALENESDY